MIEAMAISNRHGVTSLLGSCTSGRETSEKAPVSFKKNFNFIKYRELAVTRWIHEGAQMAAV
jgi:hypothetical protein